MFMKGMTSIIFCLIAAQVIAARVIDEPVLGDVEQNGGQIGIGRSVDQVGQEAAWENAQNELADFFPGNVEISARAIRWSAVGPYLIPAMELLTSILGSGVIDALRRDTFAVSQPGIDQVWISGVWSGSVISCYYHPTKTHTATTVGKVGPKQSFAAANQWACSVQTSALKGNKAYYNDSP
jgi:hypothetical protein